MAAFWKLPGDRIGKALTALRSRLAGLHRNLAAFRSPFMYPQE
jgi:hypothetical protein